MLLIRRSSKCPAEGPQVFHTPDLAEGLLGLQETGGRPAQHYVGIVIALHTAAGRTHYAVGVLNQVGRLNFPGTPIIRALCASYVAFETNL